MATVALAVPTGLVLIVLVVTSVSAAPAVPVVVTAMVAVAESTLIASDVFGLVSDITVASPVTVL